MADWELVRLGDVLSLEYGKPLPEGARDGLGYPVYGSAGEVGRHSVAMVEGPGIIVGRKGTAGRVTWSAEDYSAIDTTYWVRLADPETLLLQFAFLMLQLADLPSLSAQTGVPGLNRDRVYSQAAIRPSVLTQRRIVDLVGALDSTITSLEAEAADLAAVLESTLDLSFPITDGGTRPLGELVTARSGPSWAAPEETSKPVDGATPVVKITNTRPDGSFDTSQLAYVRGLPASTTTLNESSIVVIRTNGNRARIGNAYLPPGDVFGAAVSAFQFHVEVTEPAARDYAYWFLRAPKTQAAMSAAASGTTGLGNLALRTLRALEVPWPDEPIRDGACATLRQLQDAVDCLQAEAEALRGVRAALLPALLSGHLEVLESYDEMVGAV